MSLNISLTSAEIVALVNKHNDLKSAVLAKYLSENAPSLEITDLPEAVDEDADSKAPEPAEARL
ncbi:hypothetical protein LU631_02645 [Erwinia tracheiphila]|uniref:Uncharacterized protein n=1 Tax=Erwinia tracheiphila TaxID=65700 RepID=A0A0M2KJ31_9GAMM|nr:hypothetical protein [Erwinia tracheiphila]AXF75423.1 hypothetical protein AV903_03760 [Erwinia tracheiphila]AXF76066.1 hypothetical protein AV903_08405 [Erwinia tracheiphila]EOS94720.1 hypothetical protein ETR_12118 [Erwinia tracheiphila PSU-1]KKF37001.1 hypothetical protein SY86_18720 [Erwinia tracheiphila]UIA82031.1 hypothetical protein LU604_15435 [Erwinia tracheiphila]